MAPPRSSLLEALTQHIEAEVLRHLSSVVGELEMLKHEIEGLKAGMRAMSGTIDDTRKQIVDHRNENRAQHAGVEQRLDRIAEAIGDALKSAGRAIEAQ